MTGDKTERELVFQVDIVSGQVHGSEVRGTCRPLQVHNGMHPEGMPDEDGKAWRSHHML